MMENCPLTRETCSRQDCHWWVDFRQMKEMINTYMSEKSGRIMRYALSQIPDYEAMFGTDGMCSVKLKMLSSR